MSEAESNPSNTQAPGLLGGLYPDTLDCVHCGLCLSSCPTYRETGRETSSPRGRIYLMRGVAEGRIPLGETVAEEAHLCLGCRACETACPAGVQYGALLERTREAVEQNGLRDGPAHRLERFALRHVVPRKRTLAVLMSLLATVQRLRLDRLALPFLPQRLQEMHALLPAVPNAQSRRPMPRQYAAEGERRGRVLFFEGCVMPEMFGSVNRDTAQVLAQQGFEVIVPKGQGCCGALQAHSGDRGFATELARKNLAAFDLEGVDAIIVNSAGCGASMRDVEHWLGEEGAGFAGKVRDICEFLAEAGLRGPIEPLPLRVAYDDPCHLVHGQGVADAPRQLLGAIPQLELVVHDDPTSCCGAAGIYNLTQPEMSQAVLSRKMDTLEPTRADIIATGNPGCLMQLQVGAAKRGLRSEVLHPVELLARALLPRGR